MKCNICGGSDFVDMNKRKSVRCSSCGSLERTRLFYMYIEELQIAKGSRILHIAPEKGLYDKIRSIPDIDYVVADIDPQRYAFAKDCRHIDLTAMEDWADCRFDYIFHIHVMEHIPCNLAYPMFHLHRMLRAGGLHMCIIPFLSGRYEESLQDIGDEERTRRFGQYDHVRRLGRDDVESHLGKIVRMPESFDAASDFSVEQLRAANVPENHWKGFHIGTVLRFEKDDYQLTF